MFRAASAAARSAICVRFPAPSIPSNTSNIPRGMAGGVYLPGWGASRAACGEEEKRKTKTVRLGAPPQAVAQPLPITLRNEGAPPAKSSIALSVTVAAHSPPAVPTESGSAKTPITSHYLLCYYPTDGQRSI